MSLSLNRRAELAEQAFDEARNYSMSATTLRVMLRRAVQLGYEERKSEKAAKNV